MAAQVAEGRVIVRVRCAEDRIVFAEATPSRVRRALSGQVVRAVRRWGKQLWFELEAAPHPLFHFGMAGGFHAPATTALQLKSGPINRQGEWPPPYTKIRLELEDGGELAMTDARRFGRILLRDDPLTEPPISKLGFDPLLEPPEALVFAAALEQRGAVIKSLLLDQSFAAGVGNWIADEALFQARIDPRRRADSLTEAEARRLLRMLRKVVDKAVSVDADDTRYPRAWLFHRRWGKREGMTTANGDAIEHVSIGGRTTAWVPSRQR